MSRRRGEPGKAASIFTEQITPTVLARMGLGEAELQTALARDYLVWIRTLSFSGEHSAALNLAIEMRNSSAWDQAERWTIADARLELARLYWNEKIFWRSFLSAGHALITRPILLGRPLKPFLRKTSALS